MGKGRWKEERVVDSVERGRDERRIVKELGEGGVGGAREEATRR